MFSRDGYSYEGDDAPMKHKICPWRGRYAYEKEDVLGRGRYDREGTYAHEGEDVAMKG